MNVGKFFVVGLDLGQAQDYTALTILEKPAIEETEKPIMQIRHIERFNLGTPYPVIAKKVKSIMDRPELGRDARLVVDATGVGKAVVDLLRLEGLNCLIPVTITGGDTVIQDESGFKVPKRDLVAILQVLLQRQRLKVASDLPLSQELANELLNFKMKINLKTAHDSYGAWREGTHDDIVLAAALAAWYADKYCHPLTIHTIPKRNRLDLNGYVSDIDWSAF